MSDLHLNCVRAKDGEASESDDAVFRFLAAAKDRHHTEKTVRPPDAWAHPTLLSEPKFSQSAVKRSGQIRSWQALQMSVS
jgi:hypothetical protein